MNFLDAIAFAKELDKADPLSSFRDRFLIPVINGETQSYFLGNSLGLQPKAVRDEMDKVLNDWSSYGVEGFFMGDQPWMNFHERLALPLSNIVGAKPSEICVMNQLTVNLHLMMVSFYRPEGKRNKILCEAKAFPSDQYMFETHLRFLGLDPDEVLVEIHPREGEEQIREEDIMESIHQYKDSLALVLWGGVNYYTGQVFDMEAITRAGQVAGALVGFDLAHAAGNIRLQLHDWNVDFAAWCSYKYLNSGPGAIGGVFIHERHHRDPTVQRFGGWWGYDKSTRFLMQKGFRPMAGAEGWQLSTPSILLYACHLAALDLFMEAGWDRILEKQEKLTAYLWWLLENKIIAVHNARLRIITPADSEQHGCQVSMLVPENGKLLFDQLTSAGFVTDWREPDVIRLAPVPLYNQFLEVWQFVETLKKMLGKTD